MPREPFIYLDNNATTQVDPAVLSEMMPFLTDSYGNPSSACAFGTRVARAIAQARECVAGLLRCDPNEIVFTSGGTESNNTAFHSALRMDPDRQHIVTTRVEHSAVTKQCESLAKRGHEITWLGVDELGRIDLEELQRALRPDTAIVSIIWANNETGVLFPVQEIARIVHANKTLFHTDAVQAVGKIPIDLGAGAPIDFLSLSGHKFHAPKGVGALYVSRRIRFNPMIIGGGQERNRRAGTENAASIVAFGKACELAGEWMEHENSVVRALRDEFENGVLDQIPGTRINGDPGQRLPNTSNIAFEGVEAEALLMLLDKHQVCCSAGSACTTGSPHPSHVLRAMGFDTRHARSSLRFSFSRFNTRDEVGRALQILAQAVSRLREIL